MTFFCHFWLFFDQKVPFLIQRLIFFDQKILPLFHQHFPLFLIMVSVDHISFPSAGTGPLHIKWHEICASLPRQICFSAFFAKQGRGQGPRTVALGANPSSVYRELTRRVIIVIVIENGKRVYDVCVCECVWKGRGEGEEGEGVLM